MIDYRYSESNSRGQPFKTPNAIQFNYDDMYSYGSEMNTASANYRPGNSGTALRRKAPQKSNISGQKQLRSSMKKPKQQHSEKSAKMDPADDSFHVSPIQSQKYGKEDQGIPRSKDADLIKVEDGKDREVVKRPTTNVTLSGVSEFDYLGDDTAEKEKPKVEDEDGISDFDPTRKSLEKEFEVAADEDAEAEQDEEDFERAAEETV